MTTRAYRPCNDHTAEVQGARHVSELARGIGISRPLLYLHLEKLESAGLVRSDLSPSEDGKALRRFEVVPFNINVSADAIADLADSLTNPKKTKK